MRAKHNKIIVSADMEQKETHQIRKADGTTISLYLGRRYNSNAREKNPCVCTVVDNNAPEYRHIRTGDILVVHHNLLVKESAYLIDIIDGIAYFSIPVIQKEIDNTTRKVTEVPNRQLFAKLVDGELEPICNNLICERVKMPARSTIIIDPVEKTYEDRVRVLKVAPDVYGISRGDIALMYKMGDYEIVYHWNNKECRAIKVWAEDIIGIVNEVAA